MTPDETGAVLRRMMECAPSLEARHLFEIAAVLQGVKRTVRIVLSPAELVCTAAGLARLDLHWDVAPFGLAVGKTTHLDDAWTFHVPCDDPRVESIIVYASHEPSEIRTAFRFELEGSSDLGTLLDYPPCCVRAYEENFSEGVDWVDLLVRDWHDRNGTKGEGKAPYFANKLAYLFDGISLLPDYFPCSLYCPGAAELGARFREAALGCGLRDLVEVADAAMAKPIVVWRGLVLQPIRHGAQGCNAIVFDIGAARGFEWRPFGNGSRQAMTAATGCRFSSRGLVLLNCRGQEIGESLDASGALIQFSSGVP